MNVEIETHFNEEKCLHLTKIRLVDTVNNKKYGFCLESKEPLNEETITYYGNGLKEIYKLFPVKEGHSYIIFSPKEYETIFHPELKWGDMY